MKQITVELTITYTKGEPELPPIVNLKSKGVPVGILAANLAEVVNTLIEKLKEKEGGVKKSMGGLPVDMAHLDTLELNTLLDQCEEFDPTEFSES